MNLYKTTKRYSILFVCVLFSLLIGCKEDSERVYELLPADPELEVDLTVLGKLSVNIENSGGSSASEGSPKVVDGDLGSKFLINPYSSTLYMQLTFKVPYRIAAYTMTSANDASDRDPKNWALVASNDEQNWVELDVRNEEAFAARKETKRYDFANTTEYKYYRINITSNNGSSLFQLAEWRLIRKPLISE